jgi:hypothetical protein
LANSSPVFFPVEEREEQQIKIQFGEDKTASKRGIRLPPFCLMRFMLSKFLYLFFASDLPFFCQKNLVAI